MGFVNKKAGESSRRTRKAEDAEGRPHKSDAADVPGASARDGEERDRSGEAERARASVGERAMMQLIHKKQAESKVRRLRLLRFSA